MSAPPGPAPLPLARAVLAHFGLEEATLTPIRAGLINTTLRVDSARGAFVLQRLHPIFRPELHHDIEAITAELAAAGLPTPRLVRTHAGALWVEIEEPPEGPAPGGAAPVASDRAGAPAPLGCWRLQTALPGETIQRVERPAQAEAAGALLGRFHRSLARCAHAFRFTRQAHGLPRHRAALAEAVAAHPRHRLAAELAPLAEALLAWTDGRPGFDDLPRRVTHGDPKISNVLFWPGDQAYALIDLDTLGRLDLPTELGDALRSWCNPAGEDGAAPALDLPRFEAALTGYARETAGFVTAEERDRLVEGAAVIAAELACRFAADALNESYFGWDAARFPGRGEHNLHRARGQWALACSVEGQRAAAEAAVARAFAAAPIG